MSRAAVPAGGIYPGSWSNREVCFSFITSRYGDSECPLVTIGGD